MLWFCVMVWICRLREDFFKNSSKEKNIVKENIMIYKWLKVIENIGLICYELFIYFGFVIWWFSGENMVCINCCKIREILKVVSNVLRGCFFKNWIILCLMSIFIKLEIKKVVGMVISKEYFIRLGKVCWMM